MADPAANISLSAAEQASDDLDQQLLLALDSTDPETPDRGAAASASQEPDVHGRPHIKRQRYLPGHLLLDQDGPLVSQATNVQIAVGDPSHAGQEASNISGILKTVPAELLFRILSFLSADDLTCTAQACKYLQNATGSGMLWRRLFLARWGPIGDEIDNAKEWERPPTWKERYMERDAVELQELCGSASELMRPFYAQMTAAKRSLSLGLQHPEDLPLVNAQYAGQVVAWRRARGLPTSAPAHHTCQGRCSYSKLGNNVFVCEQCGWAHLCGDTCTERFMDLSSDLPVCPISGRCFSRMMTWAEEAREMAAKGDEGACDHLEDFSTAGRLARAYVDGYNCTNEEELRRLCGVTL